jgi:subtilisin family serine protease
LQNQRHLDWLRMKMVERKNGLSWSGFLANKLLKSEAEKIMADVQSMQEQQLVPPAVNESYADFIVQYSKNVHGPIDYVSDNFFQIINENFAVLYVPLEIVGSLVVNNYSYNSIPNCYTFMDLDSLNSSGITNLHNHPYLQLRGRGTAVAVIDSGIDYTHPAFLEGTRTRIAAIWDQSLPSIGQENIPYGREFTREEIQQALDSDRPMEIVPSTDTNGHGTFLAGIAAGSTMPASNFSGAAPEASIIVVKLKQAKQYLRDFYLLPQDVPAFQENDVMFGIWYAMRKARELRMPLSVCIGLGSNLGAHRGSSPLAQYLSSASRYSENVFSIAAGNEGNTRHHFFDTINARENQLTVELRVGEGEPGFVVEFWGDSPGAYSMKVQSPTGEVLPVSTARGNGFQILSFVFVETRIEVSYVPVERVTGETLFFFRFLSPASGIWRFLVSGEQQEEMPFHMWLPSRPFLSEQTYFLQPYPYNTITNPGNAAEAITVTAYNYRDQSLYLAASRGYAAGGGIKPDLAAPGVDILGPGPRGSFVSRSGTSVAAALNCGAAALLFEWAIVRENVVYMNGITVRNYLTRGARRRDGEKYPNPDWGYGALDLYNVFENLL